MNSATTGTRLSLKLLVLIASIALLFLSAVPLGAVAGGSLPGTIRDSTGGVIQGAKFTLVNVSLRTEIKSTSNEQGFYSFPALAVGRYEIMIEAAGFKS